MTSTVPEGVVHEDAVPSVPRREYDPVIASLILRMGELKCNIETMQAQMPTPEQWAAIDSLLVQQQESNKFWKDVRQSAIKKAVLYGLGFVGAAIIYFIYSGHPPTPGG